MSLGTYGKIGVVGGILALIGALLPWWNISANAGGYLAVSVPVLGIFTPGGILAAAFGVIGIVFATRRPSVATGTLVLISGVLAAVGAVVWGVMMPTASVSGGGASASITAGYGYWLSLVGGLVLLFAGVLAFGEARKTPGPVPTAPTL